MPPVEVDIGPVILGDPWTLGFPCFNPATWTPQSIAGYGADVSISQNFGDAAQGKSLIFVTSSANTPAGSSIAILPYTGTPGTGTICVVTPNIRAADILALWNGSNPTGASVIINGAKTTRLWYQVRILAPGGDPQTVAMGGWYLRTRS